jgi:hypothetical protein
MKRRSERSGSLPSRLESETVDQQAWLIYDPSVNINKEGYNEQHQTNNTSG